MPVEDYSFGHIVIDGKSYRKDVLILPGKGVLSPWWRAEGHLLQLEDLQEVLSSGAEVLVVGTGASGLMQVPQGLLRSLQDRGLKVFVHRSAEAVEVFNRLQREGRRVAAAFHLTC